MFSTHFLVGHPFGDPANPEDIFEGPFATLQAAQDALDTHLANNGHPGRVVTLAEVEIAASEPISGHPHRLEFLASQGTSGATLEALSDDGGTFARVKVWVGERTQTFVVRASTAQRDRMHISLPVDRVPGDALSTAAEVHGARLPVVEPTKFVLVVPFRGLDGIVPVNGRDYTGDLEQAQFAQHQYRLGGGDAGVFGLVPVKES